MKSEKQIRERVKAATRELNRIEKQVPPGSGAWRGIRRYIDALQWVLGEKDDAL